MSMKNGPHSRKFGVEIECGMYGGLRTVAPLFDFELDYNGYPTGRNKQGWALTADGSGVELKTPVLQGEHGFEQLRRAMDRLKENGAYVTDRDGLHVHFDAPEFVQNPSICPTLVSSWRNNQLAIYEMVAPRRRQRSACRSWRDDTFEELKRWAKGQTSSLVVSRNDLNLQSLKKHGSIEIRLHEGTLDADVAIAWIMFGQRFIHETLQLVRPMKRRVEDAKLLSRLKLDAESKAILAAKKAQGHITPAANYQPGY